MKLISIDIETTGLNYGQNQGYPCQILELGAVIFDPSPEVVAEDGTVDADARRWRTWEGLVKHEMLVGEPYAFTMHTEILEELAGRKKPLRNMEIYPSPIQLAHAFNEWVRTFGFTNKNKAFIVGKNFAKFDDRFLEKIPGWDLLPFHHRMLDPGSLCFNPKDGEILNLTKCLERVGVKKDVGHRSLEDALDVATVVSRFFA